MIDKKLQVKLKLVKLLIIGFATAPDRDWLKESFMTKKQLKKGREENFKHINYIANEILELFNK